MMNVECQKKVLDDAYTAYFDDWSRYGNGSVTRHALRKGYVDHIVWIHPDHWSNYSQSSVMGTSMDDLRATIRHQTYFLNPKLRHFRFLQSATTTDNAVWSAIFETESRRNMFRSVEHRPDPAHNLEINVWALSLSEYLEEPAFMEMERNNLIVDIDLDFFQCQEPAMTFMNHHGWTRQLISRFNEILQHHQYTPSHLPSEHSTEAVLTLIHRLSAADDDPTFDAMHSPPSSDRMSNEFAVPLLEDVFKVAIEERMGIVLLSIRSDSVIE